MALLDIQKNGDFFSSVSHLSKRFAHRKTLLIDYLTKSKQKALCLLYLPNNPTSDQGIIHSKIDSGLDGEMETVKKRNVGKSKDRVQMVEIKLKKITAVENKRGLKGGK